MKVGAENRTKLILAVVLMVVALLLIGNYLFSGGGSEAATPAATASSTPAPPPPDRPGVRGKKGLSAVRSLDPTLRYDWLKVSEDTKYEGNGRNIFLATVEPPPRPIAPVHTDPVQPVVTGPPPPPPITLKFFGFASRPGEPKRIFLEQGEDIFVAQEGDIIDRRYKILHITPTAVEVEDVLNNNRQSIPLTQG